MAFILVDDIVFDMPVTLREPDGNGRVREVGGTVRCRALPDDRIAEAVAGASRAADLALLTDAIVALPIAAPEGERPATEDELRRWLGFAHRRTALVNAYLGALAGDWEGNGSAPSAEPSSAAPIAPAAGA